MWDTAKARASERLGIHNASINEQLAEAWLCGQVHLPTGRMCVRPALHVGGCQFESPELAYRAADAR